MKTRMILVMAASRRAASRSVRPAASAGPYTAEQAAAGRAAYQTNCASAMRGYGPGEWAAQTGGVELFSTSGARGLRAN